MDEEERDTRTAERAFCNLLLGCDRGVFFEEKTKLSRKKAGYRRASSVLDVG